MGRSLQAVAIICTRKHISTGIFGVSLSKEPTSLDSSSKYWRSLQDCSRYSPWFRSNSWQTLCLQLPRQISSHDETHKSHSTVNLSHHPEPVPRPSINHGFQPVYLGIELILGVWAYSHTGVLHMTTTRDSQGEQWSFQSVLEKAIIMLLAWDS